MDRMINSNISNIVKEIISNKLNCEIEDNQYLWNDLNADLLDLTEISQEIDDIFDWQIYSYDILTNSRNTIYDICYKIEKKLIEARTINMRKIWVTFQRKGIHCYPAAATDPNLTDVNYLSLDHRHLFKFKVTIEVFHDDREIEFHQFLNWLESLYDYNTLDMNHKSCEMLCDDLAVLIKERYPNRQFTIDISEDGECGAECQYAPDHSG